MSDKKTQLNSENNQVNEKGSKLLSIISIALIMIVMTGFVYATSYSMFYTASLKNKFSSNISLVSFCQTNQCVSNITAQGY